MALMAKDSGGDGFEPIEPGSYIARCVSVVDIGVQETGFGPKEKVYLGFEVPSVRVEWKDQDGKDHEGPAFIGSRYTLSINEKSILGQHLTGWRGKPFTDEERQGFDLFNVLGAPCLINVIRTEKNGKTYANIQSIMRLPKGMEPAPVESELIGYTPMDNEKAANFDKLADWQKKLVRQGYKMAEGSTVIGSATQAQRQAGGPIADNQPPPVPDTGGGADFDDGFDDSIPF